jgi:hypothetical protein
MYIYDYVDMNVPVLAGMFEKRKKGYRAIGYTIGDEGSSDTQFPHLI